MQIIAPASPRNAKKNSTNRIWVGAMIEIPELTDEQFAKAIPLALEDV